MKLFRMLMSFVIALAFVFLVGYASAMLSGEGLKSVWWHSLSLPRFMPGIKFFNWGFPIIYSFFTISITVNIFKRHLNKCLILWGILGILNVLGFAVFFVWHLNLLALSLAIVMVIIITVLTSDYIKNTRELWLLMIPILSWYVFCAILVYGIVMLN